MPTDVPDTLARDLAAALTAHGLWRTETIVRERDSGRRMVLTSVDPARRAATLYCVDRPADSRPASYDILAEHYPPDLSSWATVGVLLGLLFEVTRARGRYARARFNNYTAASADITTEGGGGDPYNDTEDGGDPGAALARALLAALR